MHKSKIRSGYALFAMLCLAAAPAAPVSAAPSQVVLKVGSFLPATSEVNVDYVIPWTKQLEKDTDGKVKVQFYDGTSTLGNILNIENEVRADVLDVGMGLCSIPRGRFPRTSIMALPFMASDSAIGTRTLWSLYKEGYLKGDYRGFKVLAISDNEGAWIHTASRPVKTLADMKGLRIRSQSPIISLDLEQLGATPVGMPPSQIYVNLERGTLDGTVFEWDGIHSFHLNEVLKYHTDMPLTQDTFYLLMNKHKYESLPADVRAAIDKISGSNLEPKFSGWWRKWDRAARLDAIKRGEPLIKLSAAEKAHWRAALHPVTTKWLHHLESRGVGNAEAIYKRARVLIRKYSAASE